MSVREWFAVKKRQRLCWLVVVVVGVPLGCLAFLVELAKHDALQHYKKYGATAVRIVEINPSRSNGLRFTVQFTGDNPPCYGMSWHLLPWREHHIIK